MTFMPHQLAIVGCIDCIVDSVLNCAINLVHCSNKHQAMALQVVD